MVRRLNFAEGYRGCTTFGEGRLLVKRKRCRLCSYSDEYQAMCCEPYTGGGVKACMPHIYLGLDVSHAAGDLAPLSLKLPKVWWRS